MKCFAPAEKYIMEKSDSSFLIGLFAFIYFTSQIIIGSILHKVGTLDALTLQTTLCSEKFKAIVLEWMTSGRIGFYYQHFYLDYHIHIYLGMFFSCFHDRIYASMFQKNQN